MQFTEFPLDDRLQRALATAGFISPTPIQAAALPVAMDGRDLVGTAQTGTGKTAAFVLPILQRLVVMSRENRKTRAVILAPTRELVEQILAVVRQLATHTNVRATAVYGGVAMPQQTRALRGGVEVVVACPGRLLDHIKRGNTDLRQLDCLVLDEADRMLDMGFLPAIEEIIGHLPVKRQTLLFSATFARELNAFVQQTLRNPARVEVATAVPAQTVRHTQYQVKSSMKAEMLTALLRKLIPESDSVLIFTRTRVTANQVAELLDAAGMQADVLHAEKTQRARQDTLNQFRAGVFPYLVATDIAARGIDVASISHVINFDLPPTAEDYLHRIGRTGRMERTGHAISLVTRGDLRALREIERMLGKGMEVAQLEGSDHEAMSDRLPTLPDSRAPKRHAAPPRAAQRPSESRRQGEGTRRAAPGSRSPRADRPQGERPHRAPQRDASPARPSPAKRWEKRGAEAAPYAERPPRQRHADARPGRTEHRRRDNGTAVTSTRQPRAAESHFTGTADAGSPRQGRPSGRPFTGMAAAAKQRRKHAAGGRQPGEVAFGPRAHGKAGAARGARTGRPAGRRR